MTTITNVKGVKCVECEICSHVSAIEVYCFYCGYNENFHDDDDCDKPDWVDVEKHNCRHEFQSPRKKTRRLKRAKLPDLLDILKNGEDTYENLMAVAQEIMIEAEKMKK